MYADEEGIALVCEKADDLHAGFRQARKLASENKKFVWDEDALVNTAKSVMAVFHVDNEDGP